MEEEKWCDEAVLDKLRPVCDEIIDKASFFIHDRRLSSAPSLRKIGSRVDGVNRPGDSSGGKKILLNNDHVT